jgi:protoheme IX farnesyltransferase
MRDKTSAWFTFVSTIILIPVSLLPTIMGFGGYIIGSLSLILGLVFCWLAFNLLRKLDIESAQKVMFGSFFYLPLVQLVLLFDFVG